MSNNTNINGLIPVSTPEELHTYVTRNKENGFQDLLPDRKAFCQEYIIDYNHRKAAKETGFNPNTGIRLLREPLVSAYIEYLQEMQLTSNIITKDFINAQYMSIYEQAIGLTAQRMVTADGEEYTAKKTELGTAMNVLDRMSKSTEYVKETGAKNAPVSVSINFGELRGVPHGTPTIDIIEGEIDE